MGRVKHSVITVLNLASIENVYVKQRNNWHINIYLLKVLDPSLANYTTKQLTKLPPEKLKYIQDNGTKGNQNVQKKAEKKAMSGVETEKLLKQKDVQIQSLQAEMNRLRSKGASPGADSSSSNKLALVSAVVREAQQKKKQAVPASRLARILDSGKDFSPAEVTQAEASIPRNEPSKSCLMM